MISTKSCDNKWYPSFLDNWDDRLFRSIILERLQPGTVMLDIGAGAGIVNEMNFKTYCKEVVGVDLDPRVTSNPFLHRGIIADAVDMPLPACYFDLVVADNVMEHIDDPEGTLKEIMRVLKPGGILIFKTPNFFHYMPLIAYLTPHSFHTWINKLRGRETIDTFPTRYKLNSKSAVKRHAESLGFSVKSISLIEGRPEYLRFSCFTYYLGMLYERLVNSSKVFESFRILLIAELEKPQNP